MLSKVMLEAAAGNSGFSPLSISGCIGWYAADKLVGLADDDLLASWTDFSSAGNHLVQATATNKPTYKTAILNSKPVVRFNPSGAGGDNIMDATNAVAKAAGCLFVVLKKRTIAATGIVDKVFNIASSANTDMGRFFDIEATKWFYQNNQADSFVSVADTTNNTNWERLCLKWASNASLLFYLNNTLKDTIDPHNDIVGSGKLKLGGTANSSDYDFAEVLLYDSALSDGNRGLVDAYLAAKYAL